MSVQRTGIPRLRLGDTCAIVKMGMVLNHVAGRVPVIVTITHFNRRTR
jgi:hypothetical protein